MSNERSWLIAHHSYYSSPLYMHALLKTRISQNIIALASEGTLWLERVCLVVDGLAQDTQPFEYSN
jgi:hypothetical protein